MPNPIGKPADGPEEQLQRVDDGLSLGKVESESEQTPALAPLTDREMAIARGEDPDASNAVDSSADFQAADDAAEIDAAEQVEASREEPAPKKSEPDWTADRGVQFTAKQLGFSAEDLPAFGSADAFYAAADLLETRLHQVAKSLQQAPKPKPAEKTAEQAGEEKPPEVKILNDDGTLNADYFIKAAERGEDPYDPETIALAQAHKTLEDKYASLEQKVTAWETMQAEEIKQAQINAFHDGLDKLDPTTFGVTLDEAGRLAEITPEQNKARESVYAAVELLAERDQARAASQNRPYVPASLDDLLKRAYVLELGKLPPEKKAAPAATPQQHTIDPLGDDFDRIPGDPGLERRNGNGSLPEVSDRERLIAAASRRRGSGNGSGVNGSTRPPVHSSEQDEAARIANLPSVVKAWNKLSEENGLG